jgi:hypothetical protein
MAADPLLDERHVIDERSFAELVVWRVPQPVPGSMHAFKYRLAFVVDDICVIRYDNESGKGDHRHVGDNEEGYNFTTIDALLADFWSDVDQWQA